MPSTLVHLALGGLLAAALLGRDFDVRSLAVVLAVVAFPDLDTFIGVILPGTHRAIFHTILIPITAGAFVAYDTRFRPHSTIRRYGARGVRIVWVGIGAYLLAGIGPDLFYNGVNVFYPIHDGFYQLSGQVFISNHRGLVQTVWALGDGGSSAVGTTADVHYRTGVDVARGTDPVDAERIFPLAMSGLQLLLVLTAMVVVPARLWLDRDG